MGEGRSNMRFVQSPCGVTGEGREPGSELLFAYVGDDPGEGSSAGL
jgi:hypothetical protein